MNVLAYCAYSFRHSVRKAAGVAPLLCPPFDAETLSAHVLEGRDFIYFKLHGLPDQPFWYGDDWITALTRDHILGADLSGTIVFAANCHLPESPMLQALLAAGARAVVGGSGTNYGAIRSVRGADLLGRAFRRLIQLHLPPRTALTLARARLQLQRHIDLATIDALKFRLYPRHPRF